MKLLDSNIIIYSAKTEYAFLRDLFKEENIFISEITRLEVLGYNSITLEQEEYFNSVFSVIVNIPVSSEIIDKAIVLRKTRNLSVGDSIISFTALNSGLTLYTNNIDDFKKIDSLTVLNPLEQK